MATSSRPNSGARDTLYVNTMERYVNDRNVEDLVFENTVGLAATRSVAKVRPLPHDLSVRVMEELEDNVTPFSGYDELPTAPVKGAQAANFNVAQYASPLTISWEELMDLSTPESIADHVEFTMEKQTRNQADTLGQDIYRGSFNDNKRILGLEQALPAVTHVQRGTTSTAATTDAHNIADRYQVRQAANSYGGIQRVAWTSDNNPGTYWEGNAAGYFPESGSAGSKSDLGFNSNGGPTNTQKRFYEFYQICSWGLDQPDLIISTPTPYAQYEAAAMTKQQIHRQAGAFDANISFENIKYKKAMWVYDYYAKTYDDSDDATANGDNIYFLNMRDIQFHIDSRANFTLSTPREPINQMAVTRQLLWRGQFFLKNPRLHGRMFVAG